MSTKCFFVYIYVHFLQLSCLVFIPRYTEYHKGSNILLYILAVCHFQDNADNKFENQHAEAWNLLKLINQTLVAFIIIVLSQLLPHSIHVCFISQHLFKNIKFNKTVFIFVVVATQKKRYTQLFWKKKKNHRAKSNKRL